MEWVPTKTTRVPFGVLAAMLAASTVLAISSPAYAVIAQPTAQQVAEAVERGKEAVRSQTPPSDLYWRFGSRNTLTPHGFVMTKLGGVAVLAAHFAFRARVPTSEELARIAEDDALQVSVTVYGETPGFAIDSYIVLKQDDRLIKPVRVRADARAGRSKAWPDSPLYRAKIVGSFAYETFDPMADTTLSIFPGDGGEISFQLNFADIP